MYQSRRRKLFENMAINSAALFFAAPEKYRSNDTEYPYRQDSDFWYFSQFNEPDALLIFIKRAVTHEVIIFNRSKDEQAEIWTGKRLGQLLAKNKLSVDHAYDYDSLTRLLPILLKGLKTIYHVQGRYHYADLIVSEVLKQLRRQKEPLAQTPSVQIDWRPIVHEMRLIKSADEIEIMRKAAGICALGHIRAMEKCRPLLYEYQLESEVLYAFSQQGARYPAYNTIVGSGENGCILHYTENCHLLNDGDLVLIDAGCEYQGYASDITRTFPINGKFSSAQKEIYTLVLTMQLTAISLLKPGTTIDKVNQQIITILLTGLVKLGILTGNIETLKIESAYKPFYMHGLGHWLGLDVHDVDGGSVLAKNRILEPGMILTVEPGLYFSKNIDIPQKYQGIGIRIEDNILITETGNEVLTTGVPKGIDDIEAIMNR